MRMRLVSLQFIVQKNKLNKWKQILLARFFRLHGQSLGILIQICAPFDPGSTHLNDFPQPRIIWQKKTTRVFRPTKRNRNFSCLVSLEDDPAAT